MFGNQKIPTLTIRTALPSFKPNSLAIATKKIMADKDIYAERLGRHATEAQRMDQQFRISNHRVRSRIKRPQIPRHTKVTPQRSRMELNPSVARILGDSPSIADFATGTGLSLRLLSESLPRCQT